MLKGSSQSLSVMAVGSQAPCTVLKLGKQRQTTCLRCYSQKSSDSWQSCYPLLEHGTVPALWCTLPAVPSTCDDPGLWSSTALHWTPTSVHSVRCRLQNCNKRKKKVRHNLFLCIIYIGMGSGDKGVRLEVEASAFETQRLL